jgi:hypothetical protein
LIPEIKEFGDGSVGVRLSNEALLDEDSTIHIEGISNLFTKDGFVILILDSGSKCVFYTVRDEGIFFNRISDQALSTYDFPEWNFDYRVFRRGRQGRRRKKTETNQVKKKFTELKDYFKELESRLEQNSKMIYG